MIVIEKPPIYLQTHLTFCKCELDIVIDAALIYCAPGHLSVNVGLRYAFIIHVFTVPQATLPHMMQCRFLEGQQVINNIWNILSKMQSTIYHILDMYAWNIHEL